MCVCLNPKNVHESVQLDRVCVVQLQLYYGRSGFKLFNINVFNSRNSFIHFAHCVLDNVYPPPYNGHRSHRNYNNIIIRFYLTVWPGRASVYARTRTHAIKSISRAEKNVFIPDLWLRVICSIWHENDD